MIEEPTIEKDMKNQLHGRCRYLKVAKSKSDKKKSQKDLMQAC